MAKTDIELNISIPVRKLPSKSAANIIGPIASPERSIRSYIPVALSSPKARVCGRFENAVIRTAMPKLVLKPNTSRAKRSIFKSGRSANIINAPSEIKLEIYIDFEPNFFVKSFVVGALKYIPQIEFIMIKRQVVLEL